MFIDLGMCPKFGLVNFFWSFGYSKVTYQLFENGNFFANGFAAKALSGVLLTRFYAY